MGSSVLGLGLLCSIVLAYLSIVPSTTNFSSDISQDIKDSYKSAPFSGGVPTRTASAGNE